MKVIGINNGARLVIASPAPCILFDICSYDEKEFALKKAYDIKTKLIKECNKNILMGKNVKSNKVYKQLLLMAEPKIMTMNEFSYFQCEYVKYNSELREITEKEYMEALNLLLPFNIHYINDCIIFVLTDVLSLTHARQYVEKGGKYYTKIILLTDKSTWIYNDI